MNISIYATNIEVDVETGQVHLQGVDAGNLVAEIPQTDLLDCMEYSEVYDWLAQRQIDADEERQENEEEHKQRG